MKTPADGQRAEHSVARDLLDPLPALHAVPDDRALEQLVHLEAEEHEHGRGVQHEGADRGRGQADAPHEDHVVVHGEFGVAARAHDAAVGRHLVAGADRGQRQHGQELVGIGGGLRAQRGVNAEHDRTGGQDDAAGGQTDQQKAEGNS